MKVIFLDVDGVLNCATTKDSFGGFVGIESALVEKLSQIVDRTGARIVLCSTWKEDWELNYEEQTPMGKYLTKKLAEYGLRIISKTTGKVYDRGSGIYNWLKDRTDIEKWIVIDDKIFADYAEFDIMSHLVKTSERSGGLTEEKVEEAVKLLGEKE